MATPKVLTITLEFEVGEKKITTARLRAAHKAGVAASIEAVVAQLPEDSVIKISKRVTWDYRWTDLAGEETDYDEADED